MGQHIQQKLKKNKICVKRKNNNYPGWELKYFDKAENFRNYQFRFIKPYIKGKVAEVGPGNGVVLKRYINYSNKIYLFEPSKNFNKILKKINSKKIKIFNKNFVKKNNFYDTILYLDVLEHIKSDLSEFVKAYSSLKKNGYLIINVPAFQHLYSQFDKDIDHIKRYSKKDFLNILKKTNVKKYKIIYFDSLGYFLSLGSKIFIKKYKKNFSSKIKLWDKLIPFSIILDKVLFNRIGKSLLVIIKKWKKNF